MDNTVNYFKKLDLSEIEAKLYLTLLKTGPSSIRDLAQTADIKRTTAYFYIENLIEKGLILKLIRNSKKLVAANEPRESMQRLVNHKVDLANKIQTSFPDILKLINNTLPEKNISGISDVRYYYGKNSVKNIYLDLLYAKEIRAITNISEFLDIFPDTFQIVDKSVQNDKHKTFFELVDNSSKTNIALEESVTTTNNRYQYKYFPEGMNISSTYITIYDGKVSLVNTRDNISGVIMQSDILYNNFKLLFELIWNNVPTHQ